MASSGVAPAFRFSPPADSEEKIVADAKKLIKLANVERELKMASSEGHSAVLLLPPHYQIESIAANPPDEKTLRFIVLYHIGKQSEIRAHGRQVCPVRRFMTMANGLPLLFQPGPRPDVPADGTVYVSDFTGAASATIALEGVDCAVHVYRLKRSLKPLKEILPDPTPYALPAWS